MKHMDRSLEDTSELECPPSGRTGPSGQTSLDHMVRHIAVDPARVDSHLVGLQHSDPFAARQYMRLAATLFALNTRRLTKRLLIVSTRHRDGRTSVTLNLAGVLASARRRVLVVDTDLLRPSMLRLLGIDPQPELPGLAEGLSLGLTVAEITRRILPFNFDLLATRSPVANSLEVLGSPVFLAHLQMIADDYDFMLFDSPPLLASNDAQLLLPLVDRMLLVIRPGVTTPAEMGTALSAFRKKDLLGVVLNRVLPSSIEVQI
jgi:Mrp family chromosome partitioning ATPase